MKKYLCLKFNRKQNDFVFKIRMFALLNRMYPYILSLSCYIYSTNILIFTNYVPHCLQACTQIQIFYEIHLNLFAGIQGKKEKLIWEKIVQLLFNYSILRTKYSPLNELTQCIQFGVRKVYG